MKAYYEALQLPDTATSAEVRRAYRRLAMRYHPDRNSAPDAARRFQEVRRAYEALTSEDPYAAMATRPAPSPFEKYRHVYEAPVDPVEYAEWLNVARARAAEQARQRERDFESLRESLRHAWYYTPFKLFSYGIYALAVALSLLLFFAPAIVGWYLQTALVVLFTPVGIVGFFIFYMADDFKSTVHDLYFGTRGAEAYAWSYDEVSLPLADW